MANDLFPKVLTLDFPMLRWTKQLKLQTQQVCKQKLKSSEIIIASLISNLKVNLSFFKPIWTSYSLHHSYIILILNQKHLKTQMHSHNMPNSRFFFTSEWLCIFFRSRVFHCQRHDCHTDYQRCSDFNVGRDDNSNHLNKVKKKKTFQYENVI